jgi:hypothetical protein
VPLGMFAVFELSKKSEEGDTFGGKLTDADSRFSVQ